MTRYRSTIASVPVVLAVFAGATSCLETDPTLGEEYIPHDHMMQIAGDSSFVVKGYNVVSDSVIADGLSFNLLGGYKNPATGVSVDAGIVFQMATAYDFVQGDSLYGTRPVIDSAVVKFNVYDVSGKSGVEQVFDLYELSERVRLDSAYYFDFDPTPRMAAQPLATFTHSGEQSIEFRLEDEAFLKRLADTTGYTLDSLFKRRFKAFYLKPRTPHSDAALYRINLSSSSFLTTYYHNAEYPDTTLSISYSFAPYMVEYNTPPNQCINVIDRDYSGVLPEVRLNDTLTPNPQLFVESFGGMIARLEFTQESVEALKARVLAAGFREIVINRAQLQIGYPTRDPIERDHLPDRLGMYRDFKTRTGVADYGWYAEYSSLLQGSSSKLVYDGAIRPSRYLYEMDITHHIQQLVKGEVDKTTVYLAPSYETLLLGNSDNWSNPYTTVLAGYGSQSPPLLVLTYTMIR